jgi:hypothetical protein
VVRVQGIDEEFPRDICGAVCAEDIEGDASQPGEVRRLVSDAALVLAESYVANVVVSVFDSPMTANGSLGGFGREADLGSVVGDFVGFEPVSRFGVLVPGEAFDPNGADDQVVPIGSEAGGDIEGLDQAMLLSAMADASLGADGIERTGGGADFADFSEQRFLVGFDLGKKEIAGVAGGLKCFFDSAWRRR